MARSRSDIANSAIRIFLQKVGKFYDTKRGFEPFVPKKSQKEELLECFDHQCCYCGVAITAVTLSQDHLVPMNKEHLGLHAWGNVVPCCSGCNNSKNNRPWREFLADVATAEDCTARRQVIEQFIESRNYDPDLDLQEFAGNLYQDVGAVSMTLIDLRYKQAEEAISVALGDPDA